jgi:hypothetical protein
MSTYADCPNCRGPIINYECPSCLRKMAESLLEALESLEHAGIIPKLNSPLRPEPKFGDAVMLARLAMASAKEKL